MHFDCEEQLAEKYLPGNARTALAPPMCPRWLGLDGTPLQRGLVAQVQRCFEGLNRVSLPICRLFMYFASRSDEFEHDTPYADGRK